MSEFPKWVEGTTSGKAYWAGHEDTEDRWKEQGTIEVSCESPGLACVTVHEDWSHCDIPLEVLASLLRACGYCVCKPDWKTPEPDNCLRIGTSSILYEDGMWHVRQPESPEKVYPTFAQALGRAALDTPDGWPEGAEAEALALCRKLLGTDPWGESK